MIATLLLYLTAIHTVLQAEPRYSVPYRPEELLMAVTAVAWLLNRIAARGTPSVAPDEQITETLDPVRANE
jgi:hypothetical protein